MTFNGEKCFGCMFAMTLAGSSNQSVVENACMRILRIAVEIYRCYRRLRLCFWVHLLLGNNCHA